MPSAFRYFKVCPRGFANEIVFYRVPVEQVAEVEAEYAHFEDNRPGGGYCSWTNQQYARMPGVAIDWNDR
jgi:hypothetical protein